MVVFIAFVLDWEYPFRSKKRKLSVSGEIWYQVWLRYEEFNDDVHSLCFWTKVSFLWQIRFKKSKLFVETEIRSLDYFGYLEFDGGFHLILLYNENTFFGLIWT